MAEGRTFQELHAIAHGFRWTLAVALNDELRRGRVRRENGRYVLVREAFSPELLDALRDLTPDRLPSAAANGRWTFLPLESAGQLAASFPDVGRSGPGAIRGTRGVGLD